MVGEAGSGRRNFWELPLAILRASFAALFAWATQEDCG